MACVYTYTILMVPATCAAFSIVSEVGEGSSSCSLVGILACTSSKHLVILVMCSERGHQEVRVQMPI